MILASQFNSIVSTVFLTPLFSPSIPVSFLVWILFRLESSVFPMGCVDRLYVRSLGTVHDYRIDMCSGDEHRIEQHVRFPHPEESYPGLVHMDLLDQPERLLPVWKP